MLFLPSQEERDMLVKVGDAYGVNMKRTPAFWPVWRRLFG